MGVELLVRRSLDRKAYRIKCRFKTDPFPGPEFLVIEKVRIAERFVRDMHAQGWENVPGEGFRMRGPLPMVRTMTLHPRRLPTARDMLPGVARGERFLDMGEDIARPVLSLAESEWWEFEIIGTFVRDEILTERPDAHEEVH